MPAGRPSTSPRMRSPSRISYSLTWVAPVVGDREGGGPGRHLSFGGWQPALVIDTLRRVRAGAARDAAGATAAISAAAATAAATAVSAAVDGADSAAPWPASGRPQHVGHHRHQVEQPRRQLAVGGRHLDAEHAGQERLRDRARLDHGREVGSAPLQAVPPAGLVCGVDGGRDEAGGDQHQHHPGDPEEAGEVDAHAAAVEQPAQHRRHRQARSRRRRRWRPGGSTAGTRRPGTPPSPGPRAAPPGTPSPPARTSSPGPAPRPPRSRSCCACAGRFGGTRRSSR